MIPATSAECKRHFSAFNARQRSSMHPETFETISIVLKGFKNGLPKLLCTAVQLVHSQTWTLTSVDIVQIMYITLLYRARVASRDQYVSVLIFVHFSVFFLSYLVPNL